MLTLEQQNEILKFAGWTTDGDFWYAPDGSHLSICELPAMDPNFLFQYVVPKLDWCELLTSNEETLVVTRFGYPRNLSSWGQAKSHP